MNYYIYQVPGQLKSETLKSELSYEEVLDLFKHGEYGLREVTEKDFLKEKGYNSSKRNPWN